MTTREKPQIHLRIRLDGETAIGPGKADLLEGIRETGSIAGAGRRMNMSYKRAWLLVESMNRCFREPVVEAVRGGRARGGATLTPLGEYVLAAYRRMNEETNRAIGGEIEALRGMLADNGD
ncbi:winged helix-turn-helix domain-containing protein [Oricola cellulosilytica]|uniref:LysR family transcriptional regulator n=1 Tax=Oricola cellulosilytica TaxID=1429082 RepID=A0A4R0P3F9_9HYPH|nr:winged helix-turn-helix domain-containing protein [Oricola cellulosilytica]TCD11381.1 LysR family transcriptional regulator [Oricola cellulosilytica]